MALLDRELCNFIPVGSYLIILWYSTISILSPMVRTVLINANSKYSWFSSAFEACMENEFMRINVSGFLHTLVLKLIMFIAYL